MDYATASSFPSHPAAHFTRQAVVVTVREKAPNNTPTMSAERTLAGVGGIANRITAVRTVTRMPASKTGRTPHLHWHVPFPCNLSETSKTARYTTAIPNRTHKNAGVTVIIAENCRNAVIIPIITLATMANPAQFTRQPQPKFVIFFSPPIAVYALPFGKVRKKIIFYSGFRQLPAASSVRMRRTASISISFFTTFSFRRIGSIPAKSPRTVR